MTIVIILCAREYNRATNTCIYMYMHAKECRVTVYSPIVYLQNCQPRVLRQLLFLVFRRIRMLQAEKSKTPLMTKLSKNGVAREPKTQTPISAKTAATGDRKLLNTSPRRNGYVPTQQLADVKCGSERRKEKKKSRKFLFGPARPSLPPLHVSPTNPRGGLSNNLSSDLSRTEVSTQRATHSAPRANFYLRDDPRITGTASSGRTCEILFIAGQQQQ